MKAENLKLEELVRFSAGMIAIHGQRLIIHDLHAVGQLQRDLIQMFGVDLARRVMTRFGYFWGQADAQTMQRLFQWNNTGELLKASAALHTMKGVSLTEFRMSEMDDQQERYAFEVTWEDSAIAEAHLAEMGKNEYPTCWMLIGYMSGYTSLCLGKSIYFIERDCRAKGDSICRAEGKDVESWGQEITAHLPYFMADDIQKKITELQSRLEEMEGKLALQRKLLGNALSGSSVATVEVRSLRFQSIVTTANKVAPFDSSVLITGETGVGKDLMARYIHSLSPRAKAPFVAVNCAALPETLLESELFGHRAGAFTGAVRDQRGLFEAANTGVIFLDEIGDISPAMQVKLLRVIQEREIMRIGDTTPIKLDIRFLSSTNKNLERAVEQGKFREDLYYRLQVIHIELPPLRDRREDILPMARYFVKQNSEEMNLPNLTLDSTCIDALLEYAWPGNVRELKNAIEHAAVLCVNNIILPEHLPIRITHQRLGETAGSGVSLEDVELRHIEKILQMTDGNREETAKVLKIGIATLYRKLAKMRSMHADIMS